MKKILTLTLNPAIDKSTTIDKLVPEQKLRCATPKYEPGGGGINVSRAIRKLGGKSTAMYLSGGYSGKFFTSLLKNEQIQTLPFEIKEPTRENTIVVDESTNQQYRFGMEGPLVAAEEWQKCLDTIEKMNKIDILVGSGSLPPGVPVDFYARLAKVSKKINAKFVLDTSGEALKYAANEGCYLLKPNIGELCALVGVEDLHTDLVDEAAQELIAKGFAEVVVVSLGPAGALLVTANSWEHIPAPTVKKRSTVGAGDSMVAGMTLKLAQNKSLLEMVQFGVACGSAATMNTGTALCNPDDVEMLFASIRGKRKKK